MFKKGMRSSAPSSTLPGSHDIHVSQMIGYQRG
jgi:hypothetical protein